MPRPSWLTRMMSASSSAGSPKKFSPPSCARRSTERWIAAIDCALTRPYSVEMSLALLGNQAEQGAQVVHVQQQQAAVVGQLEYDVEYPGLGVVQFEDARQQVGPISLTVVRTGWPSLPYRSQKMVGLAAGA